MPLRVKCAVAGGAALAALLLIGVPATALAAPTAAEAQVFVAKAEADLAADNDLQARVGWIQATYITEDTNWLLAKLGAEAIEHAAHYAKEAARFDNVQVDE